MSVVEKALKDITNQHTEKELTERLDELRLEYVDHEQAEQYVLTPHEWYDEFGNGEAEDDLIAELLNGTDVALDDDQRYELIEQLHDRYTSILGVM